MQSVALIRLEATHEESHGIGRLALAALLGIAGYAITTASAVRSAQAQTMPCGPEGCGCRECIRIVNGADTGSYFMQFECDDPPNPHCMGCETEWEPDSTGNAPEGSCADWQYQFSYDCAWSGCDGEELEFGTTVGQIATLLALGDSKGAAAAIVDRRKAFYDPVTQTVALQRCKLLPPVFLHVSPANAVRLRDELRRLRIERAAHGAAPHGAAP